MLTKVLTDVDKPKYESPDIQSLRWLRMLLEALAIREDRVFKGLRIVQAFVMASAYEQKNGQWTLIPDMGWETTGKVYARVLLSDGNWRLWEFDTAAVNNRDTRYILCQVAGNDRNDVDLVLGNNNIIQALREVS